MQVCIPRPMEMLFAESSHTVFRALSGHEGLEIFSRECLDVIISDLSMPSMTGWQFAPAIKESCEAKGIPRPVFIILTGWGTNFAEEDRLDELGVDAVVRKPIRARRLITSVHQLVGERRDAESNPEVSSGTIRGPR